MDYGSRGRNTKSWERGFRKDDNRFGSRGNGSSRDPREHGGKMSMQHDPSRRRSLDEPSTAGAQLDSGVQDTGESGAGASHASKATIVDGTAGSSHQSSNALEDVEALKADDEQEGIEEDLGPTTFADLDREREASNGWGAAQAHGWGDSESVCNKISDQEVCMEVFGPTINRSNVQGDGERLELMSPVSFLFFSHLSWAIRYLYRPFHIIP